VAPLAPERFPTVGATPTAENCSSYFPAEDQVNILTGEPELALGTKYSRVTIAFLMNLIVTECVPGRRLSWSTEVDDDETGSSAFHGWVITPTDNGCHVLSEETQQGPFFLEELGRKNPGGLYRYHQEWVESLARAAETEASKARGCPPKFAAGNRASAQRVPGSRPVRRRIMLTSLSQSRS
jgi:hypothetical protein